MLSLSPDVSPSGHLKTAFTYIMTIMPKITLAIPTAITVALTLFFLLPTSVFSQAAHQSLNDKITGALLRNAARPVEKAYLQFDKPYYAAGDTIYFKAYVTLGERHRLSDQSGVLHVDLINPYNKIDQSIKLQLVNGLASGDFSLPDSLPRGRYRVRAYTRLMSGEDEPAFFECELPVNNINTQHISANPSIKNGTAAKTDIQFFPEGGTLVSGIISKVAFKAIGTDGKGVAVSGGIFNSGNNKVCSFSSAHLGMGSFNLLPQEGQSYTARIKYPDGSKGEAKLPATATSGLALTVNNDALPQVNIKIEANQVCFAQNKGKDYTMVVYSGGTGTIITCRLDTNIIVLDVAKRHLLTGVATITLFSPEGEPLSERLFFVQNYNVLKVDLKTDQTVYSPRGEVKINLNVKNRADSASAGHFSVSVVDESKVAIDENDEHTILTELLLTSDLKGKVEQPNYYFTNINDETNRNLDLVMLTHGYRRFEWKAVMSNSDTVPQYPAEKELSLKGTVKNLQGKPMPYVEVALGAIKQMIARDTLTDENGDFAFRNLYITDTAKLLIKAGKGNRSWKATISPDEIPAITKMATADTAALMTDVPPKIAEAMKKQYAQYGNMKAGIMLKQVNVHEDKNPEHLAPLLHSDNRNGAGQANQVIMGSDLGTCPTVWECLLARLRNVNWGNFTSIRTPIAVNGNTKSISVMIGGIIYQGSDAIDQLKALDGDEVYSIEALFSPYYLTVYGSQATGGLLVITLRNGSERSTVNVQPGLTTYIFRGFYKAREFYSPVYDVKAPAKSTTPDLRTTLFWKPILLTDKDGNASFEFYTSDNPGNYRIVVEGISADGAIGRGVTECSVQ